MSNLTPLQIMDIKTAAAGVEVDAGASDVIARYLHLSAAGYVEESIASGRNKAFSITAKGLEAIAEAD